MSALKVAFVGFGWFAELLTTRVFAELPEIEVVAVVERSDERRARAEELGLTAISSMDGLPDYCEAVIILTPHDTHKELVLAAAARGLHVFCEKAMAVTSADCVEMMRACREAGVVLSVGHMQKLFPTHARAITLATKGEYGSVQAMQVSGLHWCPVMPGWWRTTESCGGLLYWTGIHDLDTLRAIAASEVATAYAVTGPKSDHYTDYEDSIAVTLTYENGVIASLIVAEHDPLRTFEQSFSIGVLLDRGSIQIDPGAGEVRHSARSGLERPMAPMVERYGSFENLEEAAYRAEFRAFVATVQERGSDTTAVDGLRCVETLEAIYRSVASGQVELVVHHPAESV